MLLPEPRRAAYGRALLILVASALKPPPVSLQWLLVFWCKAHAWKLEREDAWQP
jgi:hypothetical protein